MRRFAVIGAALIGEDGVRDVTTAVDIGSKSWPFDIRLRPWAFRPGIGLLPMGFCCATSLANARKPGKSLFLKDTRAFS